MNPALGRAPPGIMAVICPVLSPVERIRHRTSTGTGLVAVTGGEIRWGSGPVIRA